MKIISLVAAAFSIILAAAAVSLQLTFAGNQNDY